MYQNSSSIQAVNSITSAEAVYSNFGNYLDVKDISVVVAQETKFGPFDETISPVTDEMYKNMLRGSVGYDKSGRKQYPTPITGNIGYNIYAKSGEDGYDKAQDSRTTLFYSA